MTSRWTMRRSSGTIRGMAGTDRRRGGAGAHAHAGRPERDALAEHLMDLVELLATIRDDEAMAEYVYAIAPGWDGTIEMPAPRGTGRPRRSPRSSSRARGRARPPTMSHAASRVGPRARHAPRGRGDHASAASGGGLTHHLANGVRAAGAGRRVATGRRSVEQPDAGQPEPGRVDLGRRGQVELVGPQAGQRALARPFDDARDEGAAAVHLVLAHVEAEEAGEGLLALALLDPVAVPGLAQRRRRRGEGLGDAGRDVVDVGAERGGLRRERLEMLRCSGLIRSESSASGSPRASSSEAASPMPSPRRSTMERCAAAACAEASPSSVVSEARTPAGSSTACMVSSRRQTQSWTSCSGQAPVLGEAGHVARHEQQGGRLGPGQREGVLAEGAPGQVAGGRAELHAEEDRAEREGELAQQPAEAAGARRGRARSGP